MTPLPAANGARGVSARRHALYISCAACIVYVNSLGNGFTYDDVPMVVRNEHVADGQPWWRPWLEPYWPGSNQGDVIDLLYRPLTVQTYAWQRRLTGLNPLPFHAVNVALHAVVSVLLWRLAVRLRMSSRSALVVGMLFALHPIHVEAVANVVGRAEILSLAGVLGAALAEDARLRIERAGAARTWRYGLATALMPACVGVAVFSKETGAAAVFVVAAWRARAQRIEARAAGGGARRIPAALLRTLAPALLVLGLYVAVRYHVCAGRLVVGGQRGGAGNFLRETDGMARLWSPFAVFGRYLALTAYPARLLCDYSLNVILPVRTPLESCALLGIGGAFAMVIATWRSFRKHGAAALVILSFAAAYVIPGNMLKQIDVVFAERLFYAPSAWICLMVGMLAAPYLDPDRAPASPAGRVFRPALAVLCVLLAGRTWLRNPVWSDTRTLMANDLAEMSPGRRSCHVCIAVAKDCIKEGDLATAEALVQEAIGIYRDSPGVHAMLAEVRERQSRYAEAVECWRRAAILAPHDLEIAARLTEARRRAEGADPEADRAAARQALEARPDDRGALRRWAQLNESVDPKAAEEAYLRLLALDATDAPAWKSLAYVRVALNRRREAVEAYRQALALSPEDWEAHTNLSVLLIDRTDAALFNPDSAIAHARRAVEINPAHWDLRVNLAEVLAHCGEDAEAAALFDDLARQSAPDSAERRMYRERAGALRSP